MIGVLVGAAFWLPPLAVAGRLAMWSRGQAEGDRQPAGVVVAVLLALVAWWVVLVGVGGGTLLLIANVWNRDFHNAALVAVPLLLWWSVMLAVIRRPRLSGAPYELVNLLALWALGLALPMLGLVLVAAAI